MDVPTAATRVDTPRRRGKVAPRTPSSMRIGHFQLLEPLGSGGMGTVYSAYDLHLDRKVAIKLVAKRSSSAEDSHNRHQRMLREAQAMAKLSHPNVVPVYEVGLDDDAVFIAMEYVAGQTLAAWRKEHERSWREILAVFVQAGKGLAAAHEVGIVHRDFKPANVLVDPHGHVRVADFGIAQVRGMPMEDESARVPRVELGEDNELLPPTPETPLTELGSLVGTPAYMSPEQFRSAAVDARSDQFSFCVALYEALFGRRPFEGHGKALAEAVKHGKPAPPDPKAGVPGWVGAIVMRGLATEPEERFGSMTELVAALAHDPGRRRRRIAIVAAGVAAVAAIAMFVGSRLTARGDAATCDGAAAQLAGAWDPAVRAAIATSFAATEVPYARSSSDAVATVLDGYGAAWTAMRTDACRATHVRGDQSEHLLDLRIACLDRRRGELGALTTVLAGTVDAKTVEKAVDAANALGPISVCADTAALLRPGSASEDPMSRARRDRLTAQIDHQRASRRVGRAKEAVAPVRALVAEARAAHDPRVLAEALELEGTLEMDTGDLKAAEVTLAEALRRARELDDVDLLVTATIDLVSTLAEGGISKSREALGVVRVAEALVDDVHDPTLKIRLALEKGDEYLVLAHPELAQPIFAAAIDDAKRLLGENHGLVFRLRALDGSALGHLGKSAEAQADYEALIASSTRTLGALHPITVNARLQRCGVMADAEQYAQATPCFAKVIGDAHRVFPVDDRELLSFREQYATSLASVGRIDDAHREYAAVLADIPESAWAEKWFIAAEAAHALGALELDLGDPRAALAHCEKAQAATEAQHSGPANATCIGEALLALDDPARALATLEPLRERIETTDPMHLGATPAMIGAWRFAYARAVWLVRHQAAQARALAATARSELGEGPARARLDAWLATLPKR